MTPGGKRNTSRGRWDLAAGDAESVLAEARKAFFVMAGILAVLWIIQIANWADHYQLTLDYGSGRATSAACPNIVSAPVLHFSWAHIEGNSGPLFIFGFLAAYRGVKKFLAVTVLVVLTSGLDRLDRRAREHRRGRRQRSGVRLLRLHHGPGILRPAPRST